MLACSQRSATLPTSCWLVWATIDLDREIADRAGDMIADGKRTGQALSVPDAIIAATAIGQRLTLVTLNQGDFRHVRA